MKGGGPASFEREDALIDLVYGALLGETSWQAFADELGRGLPDGRTTMFLHDTGRGAGNFALTAGFSAAEVRLYDSEYSRINPWMAKAAVRPIGVGVVADQMLPRRDLVRTRFHADFMRPMACESATGVTIERMDGRLFLLSVLTPQADPELNARHAALLTRLAPHLRRAMRAYRRAPALTAQDEATHLALDHLGVGALIVDGGLRIRRTSDRGARMLEAGWGLGLTPSGTLRIADETTAAALRALLAWEPGSPRTHSGQFVHADQAIRVVIVRVAGDALSLYLQGPTAVVLIDAVPGLADGDLRLSANLRSLASLHRLTPSETQVLRGLVAGATIDRLAASRGVGRETIRSQLRAIFQKTGCCRQSDLVRLVLAAGI